jgi:hypothetical protein
MNILKFSLAFTILLIKLSHADYTGRFESEYFFKFLLICPLMCNTQKALTKKGR